MQCITYQTLIYHLTGKIPDRRNVIYGHIQLGLDELLKNGHIKIIENQQKHFILDCSDLWLNTDSGNFSKISFEEVVKIFGE